MSMLQTIGKTLNFTWSVRKLIEVNSSVTPVVQLNESICLEFTCTFDATELISSVVINPEIKYVISRLPKKPQNVKPLGLENVIGFPG